MRVWQVRAVLWPVTFVVSCDRSPDHTTSTTSYLAAAALLLPGIQQLCVIVSYEQSRAQTTDNVTVY